MLRIPRFDPGSHKDFQTRKLQGDINDGADLLELLTRDTDNNEKIGSEMRSFLTNQFNNPSWERLLQARWLRKQQLNQDNDFDPEFEKIVPVVVEDSVTFKPKRESPNSKQQKNLKFTINPILEDVPQPDVKLVVEDPLNILDEEVNAENEHEKKILLTEVVQKENEAKKEI